MKGVQNPIKVLSQLPGPNHLEKLELSPFCQRADNYAQLVMTSTSVMIHHTRAVSSRMFGQSQASDE